MIKKTIFYFFLFLFSTAITAGLLEVFARLYGIIPYANRMNVYDFDNTLGWKTKKNFKFYRSTTEFSHWNYYNLEGFPTDKAGFNKTTNTLKPSIALIGDSFAEG